MLGLTQLGIFSIVVSASEAVWIISNSMSTVHYSNVINSDDRIKNRHETVVLAKQTFLISAAILCISVLVPRSVYEFVFGNEFGDVRKLIIFLIPGIISVAVSNLYDQYFAGVGKLKILRDKSLIGLAAFLVLLPLLIKKYDLAGACISMDVSYILSSLYLWFRFRKEGKESYPVISA
jgi:O-antigen/teichoic acid export membrane protein